MIYKKLTEKEAKIIKALVLQRKKPGILLTIACVLIDRCCRVIIKEDWLHISLGVVDDKLSLSSSSFLNSNHVST